MQTEYVGAWEVTSGDDVEHYSQSMGGREIESCVCKLLYIFIFTLIILLVMDD